MEIKKLEQLHKAGLCFFNETFGGNRSDCFYSVISDNKISINTTLARCSNKVTSKYNKKDKTIILVTKYEASSFDDSSNTFITKIITKTKVVDFCSLEFLSIKIDEKECSVKLG